MVLKVVAVSVLLSKVYIMDQILNNQVADIESLHNKVRTDEKSVNIYKTNYSLHFLITHYFDIFRGSVGCLKDLACLDSHGIMYNCFSLPFITDSFNFNNIPN